MLANSKPNCQRTVLTSTRQNPPSLNYQLKALNQRALARFEPGRTPAARLQPTRLSRDSEHRWVASTFNKNLRDSWKMRAYSSSSRRNALVSRGLPPIRRRTCAQIGLRIRPSFPPARHACSYARLSTWTWHHIPPTRYTWSHAGFAIWHHLPPVRHT